MADQLAPGAAFAGRYTLVRKIGGGAQGAVWLASDEQSAGRRVAIKMIHASRVDKGSSRERFAREAEIIASLDHPHIARGFGYATEGETPYIALEYLDGRSLRELLDTRSLVENHLSIPEVMRLFEQFAGAIAYAHGRGVIHRDLKPSNLFLVDSPEGVVSKIIDFGLAKILDGDEPSNATTHGRRLGTILYSSPELIEGLGADHRADLFAMGAILFEMFTLRSAWRFDARGQHALPKQQVKSDDVNGFAALLERIVRGPRPEVTAYRKDLPRAVDEVIAKALTSNREERYQTMNELLDAVRACGLEEDEALALSGTAITGDETRMTRLGDTDDARSEVAQAVADATAIIGDDTRIAARTPDSLIVEWKKPKVARTIGFAAATMIAVAIGIVLGLKTMTPEPKKEVATAEATPAPLPKAHAAAREPAPPPPTIPEPEPAPAPASAEVARPKREPRPRPQQTAAPAKRDPLRKLLEELRVDPTNADRWRTARDSLLARANASPDPRLRLSIARRVTGAAMVRDLEALEAVLDELDKTNAESPQ